MKLASRSTLCLVMLLAMFISLDHWAEPDRKRPVKMSEVSRLIDQDQTPQQVLEVMVERGVGFRMSASMEGRLQKFGFTDAQIALAGRIAAGEKVDLNAEPKPDEPGEVDAPGEDGAEPEADKDEFKVGFTDPDHWHNAEQARIERAIKNAGLGYKRIELGRATLYCNVNRANTLAPLLKKLENALIKRFPPSIANASSPKSAHIVIVDGASEWRSWVEACIDSYEQDRITFRFGPDGDPKKQLTEGNGYLLPALAAARADTRPGKESVERFATYSLGHLMMARAGGKNQPKGLTTGFGDLAEEMAMGTPSVMIYSYEKRDLKQEGGWRQVVQNLFKEKKIDSVTKPWGYETATMKPENYAECWSLVSTLGAAPDKFAKAVSAVREDGEHLHVAVREVYGLEDKDLLKAWYKFTNR